MRIDTSKRISQRDLESPIREYVEPFPYAFRADQTIEVVLREIQSHSSRKQVEYFYVLDGESQLQGMITLADLLYNLPQTLLRDILDPDVLKAHEEESLEKGLKLLSTHQILVIPVVNQSNHFVGVLELTHSKSERFYKSQKMQDKHLKDDLFQFIGFSIEQRKWGSPFNEYRLRMPWLLCNLVGGLICAVITEFYKLTLVNFVILAFFIPLVLTLSESISIQSMTLSLRFLHVKTIYWGQVMRRLYTEIRSSLLLGLTSALIIGAFYFAWSIDLLPVLGIGLSVVVSMLAASVFGGLFPIVLHMLRLDPKVAAGPVVLMMGDILTIVIYLSLNTWLLLT